MTGTDVRVAVDARAWAVRACANPHCGVHDERQCGIIQSCMPGHESWAPCMHAPTAPAQVLSGSGDRYWFSGTHLYLKIVDPGEG